jgi:predicted nuclease of restriction endonuclease-like (RecB) superfamily
MNNDLIQFHKSDSILNDMQTIIESAQSRAALSVNALLVQRNWLLGYRIAEEELNGERSENYGKEIIKTLSQKLTEQYGKGFTKSNLYSFYNFYKQYPKFFQTLSGKSNSSTSEILATASPKSLLSWSHYLVLLQVDEKEARDWYEKEAKSQAWSVRTLQRNVSTQYYYRLLKSSDKQPVENEMKALTATLQTDKLEYIKNPFVLEFLGLSEDNSLLEKELENSIISHLEKFIMELGKGYAFVARQQRIHTEKEDYFIDLVFYNYILKCFVLVDLKMGKITHQDVGQMDMYIRMYDEMKRNEGDNPTIGIVLCSDTDEDIARYSVMHGNEQLFASKYKLYLPTESQLKTEIERQKSIFYLQQEDK